ncbi:hypothetical protein DFS34DRAFT_1327 [Phlyctochytrium arcticum]|nr:hypothetical protein DFS34DRAFT_1327 [Phlyctochytrium arcticum]
MPMFKELSHAASKGHFQISRRPAQDHSAAASSKMTVLTNILLGFLGGQLFTRSIYDNVWWAHIGADPSTLKSKVTAMQRQEAVSFYHNVAHQPSNMQYVTIAVAALILISTGGQTIVNKAQRVLNLMSFLTFAAAGAVYLIKVHPTIQQFAGVTRQKADTETRMLFELAIWQGAAGILVGFCLLMQASLSEQEEEESRSGRISSSSSGSGSVKKKRQ